MGVYISRIKLHNPKNALVSDFIDNNNSQSKNGNIVSNDFLNKRKFGVSDRRLYVYENILEDIFFECGKSAVNKIDISSIKTVIVCSHFPDYRFPFTSSVLRRKLGLNNYINCVDIVTGGDCFSTGVSLAKNSISNGEKALVFFGDDYSLIANAKDRRLKIYYDDIASAVMLSNKKEYKSGIVDILTYDCAESASYSLIEDENKANKTDNKNDLYMDGKQIYRFCSANRVAELISGCLTNNKLLIKDIKFFIFQDCSTKFLEKTIMSLSINSSKIIYDNTAGNLLSSSIPYMVKKVFSNKLVEKGDKIIIISSGRGVKSSVMLYQV